MVPVNENRLDQLKTRFGTDSMDDERKDLSMEVLRSAVVQLGLQADGLVLYPWRRYTLDDEAAEIIKQYLCSDYTNVDISMIDDFRSQNTARVRIEDIYGALPWPQSESDPNALLISAPGFSSNRAYAMISIGTHYDGLGASGGTYIFVKDLGRWVKLVQVQSWIA